MSEIDKKARASIKGGSLHTSGAQGQGNVTRKLEKGLGSPIMQRHSRLHTQGIRKSWRS
ncbi:hypothetical protein P3L10_013788 [Capsicum annuum]